MRKYLLATLFCALPLLPLKASDPSWWTTGTNQIIISGGTASNYSPANLGQLKFVATQAAGHLNENLPGGAGYTIDSMIAGFQSGTSPEVIAGNYAPINLGQLKAVAKPYYDLLLSYGYNTKANLIAQGVASDWAFDYPWDPDTPVADNYAPANLGQLKLVFSFDLTSYDADDNGIPDVWEYNHYGWYGIDPNGNDDGDSLTNLEEYQQGSDPNDYYSQGSTTIIPYLSILSGNNQEGNEGACLTSPLIVEVRSGSSTGTLLNAAPVTFTVTTGSGGLSTDNESDYTSSTLSVTTGTDGKAQVYYKEGMAGLVNVITAASGTSASATFYTQAYGENGLVAHYQFDGTSGSTATDVGPFSFTGTLINGPTWTARYTGEGSISLDGSNDYVKVGTGTSGMLDFRSNSFSLVAWIKSGTDGQAGRIISKGQASSTAGYELAITGSGQIEAGLGTTQTGTSAETILIQTTGSTSLHDGLWHQVAAVFDRASSLAQIYVDGTSRALTQVVSTGGTIHTGTTNILDFAALTYLSGSNSGIPLTISSHNGSQDFFKGGLDDVRIYRKALTGAEVVSIRDEEGILTATTTSKNLYEDTLGIFDLESKGGGITPPVYTITGSTSNGYIALDGSTVSYYPNAHWSGTDSFQYQVIKGARVSSGTTTLIVAGVDTPPLVSVGGGQSIVLPNTLSLTGVITDIDTDPGDVYVVWSKDSGTGTVTFSSTDTLSTTATFDAPGQYVLRLTARDGSSIRSDSLMVMVNSSSANPPTITLQAPTDNTAVALNTAVLLQASATTSGTGTTIAKVEFYQGSEKLGEATTTTGTSSYYELSWTPPDPGVYAITAFAIDSNGAAKASSMARLRATDGGAFSGTNLLAGNDGRAGSGGPQGVPSNANTGSGQYSSSNATQAGQSTVGTQNSQSQDRNNPNYDGDGLPDDEDAVIRDGDLSFRKVSESKYVVIDIGEADVVMALNNAGQALIRSGTTCYICSGTQRTAIPMEASAILPNLADDGTVLRNPTTYTGTSSGRYILKWKPGMGDPVPAVELSANIEEHEDEDSHHWIGVVFTATADLLSPGGTVYYSLTSGTSNVNYSSTPYYEGGSDNVSANTGPSYSNDWKYYPDGSPTRYYNETGTRNRVIAATTVGGSDKIIHLESSFSGCSFNEFYSDTGFTYSYAGTVSSTLKLNNQALATSQSSYFAFNGSVNDYPAVWREGGSSPLTSTSLDITSIATLSQVTKTGTNSQTAYVGRDNANLTSCLWLDNGAAGTKKILALDADHEIPISGAPIAINDRGEILFGNGIWQNDRLVNVITDRLAVSVRNAYSEITLNCLNNHGTILAGGKLNSDHKHHALLLVPVEIINKNKEGLTKLKVGKMVDSGVITGSGASATLDIEKDSDRFYVRLPGCAGIGGGAIKVATIENPEASLYNEKETTIDLQVDGNDLITKSLLLVADDVDDRVRVDNVKDNDKNDRTYKVQLGGKLQIKSVTINGVAQKVDARIPVPVKKTVDATIVILTIAGAPITDSTILAPYLRNVEERYAQVGIKFHWHFQVASQPSGVNLADGLTTSTTSAIASEESALLIGLATNSQSDMQIFILNSLSVGPLTKLYGRSYPVFFAAGTKYVNSIIIDFSLLPVNVGRYTIAHEIGHVLTNEGHFGGEGSTFTAEQRRNLMLKGPSRNTGVNVDGGRRLTDAQEKLMQNHQLSK